MNISQTNSIYGSNLENLEAIRHEVVSSIQNLRREIEIETGLDPVEHCLSRIKGEDSMREKCTRKQLPATTQSALVDIHDAIGIRVVCAFLSDVYLVRDHLAQLEGYSIYSEKDYIKNVKPNGYRSYHMIMRSDTEKKPLGCDNALGYFIEVQLRTISMDTWAALEHHLKYKKEAPHNEKLIVSELKRCADELASTDLSMQSLRDLIVES